MKDWEDARCGRTFNANLGCFQVQEGEQKLSQQESDDSLLDLISGFGQQAEKEGKAAGTREEAKKSGKGKGGQK